LDPAFKGVPIKKNGKGINDESFANEVPALFNLNHTRTVLSAAMHSPVALSLSGVSSHQETAGAILIREQNGQIVPTGIKVIDSDVATETSVAISLEAYQNLGTAFVPFHTHLGHPHSFKGLARFAPTAADVRAHRALMSDNAARGTSLRLPGVILHASGEVTMFWVGATDDVAVRYEVVSRESRQMAQVSVQQLEIAERTGELVVQVLGESAIRANSLGGMIYLTWTMIDLWDRRLILS
jgi:hypothetical protein